MLQSGGLLPKGDGYDGTHHSLAIKPSLYGNDHFTHKSKCGVAAMVVNYDKKGIHYLNLTWQQYFPP
jgi:hypothetical protein